MNGRRQNNTVHASEMPKASRKRHKRFSVRKYMQKNAHPTFQTGTK